MSTRAVDASATALRAPLTFAPRFKQYLWGGRRLELLLGRALPEGDVAESWEISGHPSAPTVVNSGPLAGRDLLSLMARHGADLVGTRAVAAARRTFPMLIKLLDANHALSVQVHPGDVQAAARQLGETGKSEMWYVLHAEAGAQIIHGLRPGIARADLARALARGRVQDCLRRVPVAAGDAVFVPAGTVHAILSGIVLVEIQQNSDTTYRLHDWDRTDESGDPRQLHQEQALDVVDFDHPTAPAHAIPELLRSGPGHSQELLVACDHFMVERVRFEPHGVFKGDLRGDTFEIWGVLSGSVSVETPGGPAQVQTLDGVQFVLLPATMGPYRLTASSRAVLLRAYLPRRRPGSRLPVDEGQPEPPPCPQSAPPGTRTPNLPIKSRMLYQLS